MIHENSVEFIVGMGDDSSPEDKNRDLHDTESNKHPEEPTLEVPARETFIALPDSAVSAMLQERNRAMLSMQPSLQDHLLAQILTQQPSDTSEDNLLRFLRQQQQQQKHLYNPLVPSLPAAGFPGLNPNSLFAVPPFLANPTFSCASQGFATHPDPYLRATLGSGTVNLPSLSWHPWWGASNQNAAAAGSLSSSSAHLSSSDRSPDHRQQPHDGTSKSAPLPKHPSNISSSPKKVDSAANTPSVTRRHSNSCAETPSGKKGKETDRPKRPLSAYNLFFRKQRELLLRQIPDSDSKGGSVDDNNDDEDKKPPARRNRNPGRPKPHGKIKFEEMGKMIGAKWKRLTDHEKEPYHREAAMLKEIYSKEKEKWNERHQQKMSQQRADLENSVDPKIRDRYFASGGGASKSNKKRKKDPDDKDDKNKDHQA